jgi:DNA-directed RNA polymerase specialized sigma24 family protein
MNPSKNPSNKSNKKSLSDSQKNDPRLRLLQDRQLEKLVRFVLKMNGYPKNELRDGLQEVLLRALLWFVDHEPPGDLEGMKALCATIAHRYAVDRLRRKDVKDKYEGTLGEQEEPDDYELPTPSGEQRDPVDAGRQLEVAAGLFRERRMPEHGVDILEGVACECTFEEVGEDVGITAGAVEGRLRTMRRVFKRRIEERGMG